MTLARAFAPELESGATEFCAVTAPLDPETKRLRRRSPGALADEALALEKRIDAIKDEAIRRRLKTAEGEAGRNAAEIQGFCDAVPEVRIHLPPAESRARRASHRRGLSCSAAME
jgi:hypothetical protein